MNLNQKYKLIYTHDQAAAMKNFLTGVISLIPTDPAEKILFCLAARVIDKIHKRDLSSSSARMEFKINEEQSLALQLIMTKYCWPGGFIDNVLRHTQQQLPPLIFSDSRPAALAAGEEVKGIG